jgi:hypothetical protein
MSCPFTHEELEDRANDQLPEPRAREVDAHVAGCSDCRDELDWLRLERLAFEERRASGEEHKEELWRGIEQRLETAEADADSPDRSGQVVRLAGRQRAAWFGSGFAAAAMAASVLFFYVRAPQVAEPRPVQAAADAGANQRPITTVAAPSEEFGTAALTEAEAQYADAIGALEAEFAARRAELPDDLASAHEQAFEQGHSLIAAARKDAGDDVDARMRVLDAYSAHLRTVQTAMSSFD